MTPAGFLMYPSRTPTPYDLFEAQRDIPKLPTEGRPQYVVVR